MCLLLVVEAFFIYFRLVWFFLFCFAGWGCKVFDGVKERFMDGWVGGIYRHGGGGLLWFMALFGTVFYGE